MSRVLVTGANGAVGPMVMAELIDRGDEVIGYDLAGRPGYRPPADGYPLVEGDILDLALLRRTLREHRIEAVVHAAAVLPDGADADPFRALQVNVAGTGCVAEAVMREGAGRLVFCSTHGVLADFAGDHLHPHYRPVDESYPTVPPDNAHTLYNSNKICCEHYLNKLRRLRGLDALILRFTNMYGPGRTRHGSRAIPSAMVEAALAGSPHTVATGGDERFDLIYTRDVARGIAAAVHAERPEHHTFHIATGRGVSLDDLAAAIRECLPEARLSVGRGLDPFRLGYPCCCIFDISRARRELGYEPKYSLQDGLRDYIELLRRGRQE